MLKSVGPVVELIAVKAVCLSLRSLRVRTRSCMKVSEKNVSSPPTPKKSVLSSRVRTVRV